MNIFIHRPTAFMNDNGTGPDLSRSSFFKAPHFTLVKEALIEIGCVVSLVVGCLVVTRVHCGQTVHHRPIVRLLWNTNRKPYPRNSVVQISTPWDDP